MKVFIDANILVSVLNKEYPLFSVTSRILSFAGDSHFEIYTPPICLAISFYFAEKKSKTKIANQKIALLCKHIKITKTDELTVKQVIKNPAINDFEDGLEYYSAKESNCNCLVTEDLTTFIFLI